MAMFFSQLQQDPAKAGPNFLKSMRLGFDYMMYPLQLADKGIHSLDGLARNGSTTPLTNDSISLVLDDPAYAEFIAGLDYASRVGSDVQSLAHDLDKAITGTDDGPEFIPHMIGAEERINRARPRFHPQPRIGVVRHTGRKFFPPQPVQQTAPPPVSVPSGFDFRGGPTLSDESMRIQ